MDTMPERQTKKDCRMVRGLGVTQRLSTLGADFKVTQ